MLRGSRCRCCRRRCAVLWAIPGREQMHAVASVLSNVGQQLERQIRQRDAMRPPALEPRGWNFPSIAVNLAPLSAGRLTFTNARSKDELEGKGRGARHACQLSVEPQPLDLFVVQRAARAGVPCCVRSRPPGWRRRSPREMANRNMRDSSPDGAVCCHAGAPLVDLVDERGDVAPRYVLHLEMAQGGHDVDVQLALVLLAKSGC